MRKPLVVGNWKMNGSLSGIGPLLDEIIRGAAAIRKVELAVCPPFVYLPFVSAYLAGKKIALGAQNVAHEAKGAFTGEVSAPMLVDHRCRYVIIGHSERRQLFHETDGLIAQKVEQARQRGLTPILCVGETLKQRESGETEAVVSEQVQAVLNRVGSAMLRHAVIAYEPVWAIGTGVTATPTQAQAVHAFLRGLLAEFDAASANTLRILYGGSVKASNAADLFSMPDIDGGLIGGASLEAAEFLAICHAASSRSKQC